MRLTSVEAAEALGITTSGLRSLVGRGRLAPIEADAHLGPGRSQLEFWATDVFDLQVARRSRSDIAWHDALWAAVDQVLAGQPAA